MLARAVAAPAVVVQKQLVELLGRWTIPAPKKVDLKKLCARMSDEKWWVRNLRRHVGRLMENFAREIGAVSRREGVYASDDAVHRYRQRQRRARIYFEHTEMENLATGETLPMADVIAASVSNPANRRNELMTRMKGFEDWAVSQGHVSMFYTITCPSKFHRENSDGRRNPKFDGSTAKEGQAYLCDLWNDFRSWYHKRGIRPYGFRIAEPHHDGTPHWHLLLFVRAEDSGRFTDGLRSYALRMDGAEPGAAAHRFEATSTSDPSKGTATGYLAKYIAKNVDGFEVGEDFEANAPAATTVDRALTWARTHCIRQFQQIGGPSVTVWREFRRVRTVPEGAVLAAAWACADGGNWCGFVMHMGGTSCARADRPVSIWTLAPPGRLNSYYEPAEARVHGLRCGRRELVTRPHEWALRPCRGVPRTRGNNCTATETGGHRVPPKNINERRPESAWEG